MRSAQKDAVGTAGQTAEEDDAVGTTGQTA